MLCVGLDSDIEKIPSQYLDFENPVLAFNKAVIEATKDFAVAYKPNLAFYESLGDSGFSTLKQTLDLIPSNCYTIADAKRGDIGNTAKHYAKTFFEYMNFDSVTLSPYMGMDTVEPFLAYENKVAIVLGLTSNPGSSDFQRTQIEENTLATKVVDTFGRSFTENQLMFVIGATHGNEIARFREIVPNHFFLVPGVGAQGGTVDVIMEHGSNKNGGLLINSSRGVIFADGKSTHKESVAQAAKNLQSEMEHYMN